MVDDRRRDPTTSTLPAMANPIAIDRFRRLPPVYAIGVSGRGGTSPGGVDVVGVLVAGGLD